MTHNARSSSSIRRSAAQSSVKSKPPPPTTTPFLPLGPRRLPPPRRVPPRLVARRIRALNPRACRPGSPRRQWRTSRWTRRCRSTCSARACASPSSRRRGSAAASPPPRTPTSRSPGSFHRFPRQSWGAASVAVVPPLAASAMYSVAVVSPWMICWYFPLTPLGFASWRQKE